MKKKMLIGKYFNTQKPLPYLFRNNYCYPVKNEIVKIYGKL